MVRIRPPAIHRRPIPTDLTTTQSWPTQLAASVTADATHRGKLSSIPAQVRPLKSLRANYHSEELSTSISQVVSTFLFSHTNPSSPTRFDMFARSLVRPALSAVKVQPQQQAGMATLREIEMR
jgi:hypothetical protein